MLLENFNSLKRLENPCLEQGKREPSILYTCCAYHRLRALSEIPPVLLNPLKLLESGFKAGGLSAHQAAQPLTASTLNELKYGCKTIELDSNSVLPTKISLITLIVPAILKVCPR